MCEKKWRGSSLYSSLFTAADTLRTIRQVRPDIGIWRISPADKAVPGTDRIWNISSGTGYLTKWMWYIRYIPDSRDSAEAGGLRGIMPPNKMRLYYKCVSCHLFEMCFWVQEDRISRKKHSVDIRKISVMSGKYPVNIRKISRRYPRNIRCIRRISVMSGKYPGNIHKISGTYA